MISEDLLGQRLIAGKRESSGVAACVRLLAQLQITDDMLVEMAERYGKPLFLSETGAEGSGKPSWLHYVCSEVRDAMDRGADIRGICWYPITAYPGWDNSRHAETGLLSTVVADGSRHVDQRLLAEAHEAAGTNDDRPVVETGLREVLRRLIPAQAAASPLHTLRSSGVDATGT